MTESRYPTPTPIDDELLSAYIDGQVTTAERQRVEQALAKDAQVRERYETLQMTVTLMQDAPPVRVPRAFVLSEAQVLAAGGKVKGVKQPSFFERIFPRMMPLATAAVALLLVVLVSVDFLPGFAGGMNAPQPVSARNGNRSSACAGYGTDREMPAESAIEEVGRDGTRGRVDCAGRERSCWQPSVVEELAKREDVSSLNEALVRCALVNEAPAARAAAKSSVQKSPMPVLLQKRQWRAMPEGEIAADEAESMLEAAGDSAESFGADSSEQEDQVAELASEPAEDDAPRIAIESDGGRPTWLRPLEFILALLFVVLLVGTFLLRKRTHADTP